MQLRGVALLCVLWLILLCPVCADQSSDLQSCINWVIHRYQHCSFSRVATLGSPALFQNALQKATIAIDPKTCGDRQGLAEKNTLTGSTTIYLTVRPQAPELAGVNYCVTAWHETMHLIEYVHGEDPHAPADWGERHSEYFEDAFNALTTLEKMERDAANPATTDDQLLAQWNTFAGRMAKAGRTGPPNDLAEFAKWSGCRVDAGEIRRHYEAGGGGPRLQALFTSKVGVEELVFTHLHVEKGSSPEELDLITQFELRGPKWDRSINIRWDAAVTGPQGFSIVRNGNFSRGGGFQGATSTINIGNAPSGLLNVTVSLTAQGKTRTLTAQHQNQIKALQVSLAGPAELKEGESAALIGQIQGGKPPYQWYWTENGKSGGSGSAANPTTSVGQATAPEMFYVLTVKDAQGGNPIVRTHRITVRKAVPLALDVDAPSEAVVGKLIDLFARVTGPKPWQVDWKADVATGSGPGVRFLYRTPGPKQIQAKVTSGSQEVSKMVTIQVYPELTGAIEGPDEVPPGGAVAFQAKCQGGKSTYHYLWTGEDGLQANGESIQGHLRGQIGQEKVLSLTVTDSMTPPQKLDIIKRVKIKGPTIQLRRVYSVPETVTPGEQAIMHVDMTISGFGADPVVTPSFRFWLEGSSGSGGGTARDFIVAIPQDQSYDVHAGILVPTDGKPGTIRLQAVVKLGDVERIIDGTAVLAGANQTPTNTTTTTNLDPGSGILTGEWSGRCQLFRNIACGPADAWIFLNHNDKDQSVSAGLMTYLDKGHPNSLLGNLGTPAGGNLYGTLNGQGLYLLSEGAADITCMNLQVIHKDLITGTVTIQGNVVPIELHRKPPSPP